MQSRVLRIGTRGSPLALAQATMVQAQLASALGVTAEAFELKIIRTSGDVIQDRPLSEVGGKGLFTKEIEEALIAGAIDLAVHSAKDLPTQLPPGLAIVPEVSASSISLVNRPLPPTSDSGRSWMRSPEVRITLIATASSAQPCALASASRTAWAWTSASGLPRVPIRATTSDEGDSDAANATS